MPTITCCGSEHETLFCPNCGRQLLKSSLLGLLKHVRFRRDEYARRLKKWTDKNAEEGREPPPEWVKRTFDKWSDWTAALEEILKRHNPVHAGLWRR